MRRAAAVSTALALTTASAHATSIDLGTLDAHTREVIERHATQPRRERIIGGISLTVIGVGTVVGGFYLIKTDGYLSDDVRDGVGYGVVALGALLLLGATMLRVPTDVEQMHTRIREGGGEEVRNARVLAYDAANQARRRRPILRGVGLVGLGLGAATVVVGATLARDTSATTQGLLIGGGLALAAVGGGLALGSLFQTRMEQINGELQIRIPSFAIAPIRGGAVAGIHGTF